MGKCLGRHPGQPAVELIPSERRYIWLAASMDRDILPANRRVRAQQLGLDGGIELAIEGVSQ